VIKTGRVELSHAENRYHHYQSNSTHQNRDEVSPTANGGDGSPKVLIGAHPSGHAIHDDTDFLPFQI